MVWEILEKATTVAMLGFVASSMLAMGTGPNLVSLMRVEILSILEKVIGVPMMTILLFASRTNEVCERFPNGLDIGLAKEQQGQAPLSLFFFLIPSRPGSHSYTVPGTARRSRNRGPGLRATAGCMP